MKIRLALLLAGSMLVGYAAAQPQGNNVSVKQFGAKGNGVADDYSAMVAAAKYVCSHPGSTLTYPPGTYAIKQYKITGGPQKNAVDDVIYDGCKNVTIIGSGATIDVFGRFRRSSDYSRGKYSYSYSNEVTPIKIVNSDAVTVKGFTLNGNVSNMTRDAGVYESPAAGISTGNASKIMIQDITVSEFQTDGVYIGSGLGKHADRNITLKNVKASHNARLGLALIQVDGARIEDSEFVENGRGTGSYGFHLPAGGVDIEPNVIYPENIDAPTANIVFEHDIFASNEGFQAVSTVPTGVASVTMNNCTIDATDSDRGFSMSPASGTFTNNIFKMGPKSMVAMVAYVTPERRSALKQLVYRGNKFYLARSGGITTSVPDRRGPLPAIIFDQNTVTVRASGSDPTTLMLHNATQITNNKFVMNRAALGSKSPQKAVQMPGNNSREAVNGNTFSVDNQR